MELEGKMEENLFIFVVSFFLNWGYQTLGKIANPVTGKTEKDLPMTQRIIEILQMLKEKTKGNLDEKEEKFLTNAITELQLNYVEEVNKKDEQQKSEGETKTTS